MDKLFDSVVNYMSLRGYQLTSQSAEKIQMVKPQKKSCFLIILLFLCGFIPAIFYVLITRDRSLMISAYPDKFVAIDERGKQKTVSRSLIEQGQYSTLIPGRFPWMVIGLLLGLFVLILIISALSSGGGSAEGAFLMLSYL